MHEQEDILFDRNVIVPILAAVDIVNVAAQSIKSSWCCAWVFYSFRQISVQ